MPVSVVPGEKNEQPSTAPIWDIKCCSLWKSRAKYHGVISLEMCAVGNSVLSSITSSKWFYEHMVEWWWWPKICIVVLAAVHFSLKAHTIFIYLFFCSLRLDPFRFVSVWLLTWILVIWALHHEICNENIKQKKWENDQQKKKITGNVMKDDWKAKINWYWIHFEWETRLQWRCGLTNKQNAKNGCTIVFFCIYFFWRCVSSWTTLNHV